MQIVTDSGTDVTLSPEQMGGVVVHTVPLVVTLEGKSYRENVDIQAEEFYRLLEASHEMPVTSQPSAGVFAEVYSKLAESDPEILSIHISSGLSGTLNAAMAGASQVPQAHVTFVDTKTLSAAAGWQVAAAVKGVQAGWTLEKILASLKQVGEAADSLYTLNELKYLIHGGRISHMKGLIASLLNIKPIIGVEKVHGKYVQQGQARTFKGAIKGLADVIARQFAPGSALRVQVLHAFNPEGAEMLREELDRRFRCSWLPLGPMSLVLGAHTGPSMVGAAYAPLEAFSQFA
jgi:DegV family protein with EDD domain